VKAIREALVNLLIHSDYFSLMKPRIRVFINRIEFFNPGALPKPYEELQKGDISLPRNPLITKIFRIIDLAENAGYGFDKMIKGWYSYYSNLPIISGDIDSYKIEFYFNQKYTVEETVEETVDKIFSLIKNNSSITAKELSLHIGLTRRGIEWNLANLKKQGVIERIGSTKKGFWKINKK
jgi:ATP-dependent DNA helicase RecG